MGIFSKKNQQTNKSPQDDARVVAEEVFDDTFKEELRQLGRDHFKQLLDSQATEIPKSIEQIVSTLSAEMKSYVSSQLDLILSKISKDITGQLNDQMSSYQKSSDQAQELVAQSLNRNAQAIYAKYQQMVTDLQHVISDQEMMMVGVFQDNKSKVIEVQAQQDKALQELNAAMTGTKQQTERISGELKAVMNDQVARFSAVYNDNISRLEQSRSAQEASLKTLAASVATLEHQHQQLKQLMDTALEKQKALIADTVNQHMSKIVEHYLVTTLGDNSDIVANLPSILEKLNASKQAMQEDMKL